MGCRFRQKGPRSPAEELVFEQELPLRANQGTWGIPGGEQCSERIPRRLRLLDEPVGDTPCLPSKWIKNSSSSEPAPALPGRQWPLSKKRVHRKREQHSILRRAGGFRSLGRKVLKSQLQQDEGSFLNHLCLGFFISRGDNSSASSEG